MGIAQSRTRTARTLAPPAFRAGTGLTRSAPAASTDVQEVVDPCRGSSRIVLAVIDGLGGLPAEADGPTELEAARTPVLDRLAASNATGLHVPVRPWITPGSGPA